MPLPGPTVMLTVKLPNTAATVDEARARLGLSADEVDEEFGLVPLDPAKGTFALLVTAEAGERVAKTAGVSGPYANPPIEPLGPPRPKRKPDDG